MPTVRVFQNPDGTVRIMRLNERRRRPGETDSQFFARETAKQPELAGLSFTDVDDTTLPTSRGKRHAWRVMAGRVQEDAAVPDKPHPRQGLLNRADAAQTLPELKAIIRELIQGGIG
jgi:hypothetical protein